MHRASRDQLRYRWYLRLLLADQRARIQVNAPQGGFRAGRASFVQAPEPPMVAAPPPPPPPPSFPIGLPGVGVSF